MNWLPLSHQGSLPHRLNLLQSNQPFACPLTPGPCPQSEDLFFFLVQGSLHCLFLHSEDSFPENLLSYSIAQILYQPCSNLIFSGRTTLLVYFLLKLSSVPTAFISFSVLSPLCLHLFLKNLLKDILCISVQECQHHNGSRLSICS